MCMRFYIKYSIQAQHAITSSRDPAPDRRSGTSALSLDRQGDRPAVELDPGDLDRVDDSRRQVDEDRGSHADLQRAGSDDSGFLKSSVAHRGASRQAAGKGGLKRQGRP